LVRGGLEQLWQKLGVNGAQEACALVRLRLSGAAEPAERPQGVDLG